MKIVLTFKNLVHILYYISLFRFYVKFYFRDACVVHISRRITPILTNVIAYLDRNLNLDIIEADNEAWVVGYWLLVLSDDILPMHTRTMLCYRTLNEQNEITIPTSGFEGQQFSNRLPFSWMLYEALESQYRPNFGRCFRLVKYKNT